MIVLPLVLQANERILAERDRLSGLGKSGGKKIGAKDRAWLDKLAVSYGLETADMKELTLRVDIIPPSLAIAQAVVESGWGTSRFATEGNALFGQWTEQGRRTMVPADRSFGRTHAVRRFKTLKLLISDDHKGLKAAATRILGATWQRCRVHFARNLLAHAGRQGRRVVSAFGRHRLRPGGRRQREGPVASGRRPAQAQGAQAGSSHGRSRARRPRLT